MAQYSYSNANPLFFNGDIAQRLAGQMGTTNDTFGGYTSTATPWGPGSMYVQKPGTPWAPMPSVTPVNVFAEAGSMMPNTSPMAGPVKGTTGGGYNPNSTAETAQKLAQERKDREDAMREWQKQWNEQKRKEQQDLRDRLAEIRAQGQESRKTSYQDYEQARKLAEEGKQMSRDQVLMQLLSSLGMF